MTSNAEFAAAAYVLRAPVLADRTGEYVDEERQSIDFDQLLEDSGTWSGGERLLVRVALDMWNGLGQATLGQVVNTLDDGNLQIVLDAICIRRGLMALGG